MMLERTNDPPPRAAGATGFPSPLRGGVRGGGREVLCLASGTPTRHVASKANLRRDAPPSPQGGGYAAARSLLNCERRFHCSLAPDQVRGSPSVITDGWG